MTPDPRSHAEGTDLARLGDSLEAAVALDLAGGHPQRARALPHRSRRAMVLATVVALAVGAGIATQVARSGGPAAPVTVQVDHGDAPATSGPSSTTTPTTSAVPEPDGTRTFPGVLPTCGPLPAGPGPFLCTADGDAALVRPVDGAAGSTGTTADRTDADAYDLVT